MATWSEIEAAAPELAGRARAAFDAHKHKVLATLRRDGSPRISGIEATFADGELWLGMMPGSRKALDLRRDPRFALHSGSEDPPGWSGDAKLAGVAEEITDPALVQEMNGEAASPGQSHLFRLDLREVSTVGLNEQRNGLVIDIWTPEGGVQAQSPSYVAPLPSSTVPAKKRVWVLAPTVVSHGTFDGLKMLPAPGPEFPAEFAT